MFGWLSEASSLRLALEALEPLGVARELRGQRLDRDLAPQARVAGAVAPRPCRRRRAARGSRRGRAASRLRASSRACRLRPVRRQSQFGPPRGRRSRGSIRKRSPSRVRRPADALRQRGRAAPAARPEAVPVRNSRGRLRRSFSRSIVQRPRARRGPQRAQVRAGARSGSRTPRGGDRAPGRTRCRPRDLARRRGRGRAPTFRRARSGRCARTPPVAQVGPRRGAVEGNGPQVPRAGSRARPSRPSTATRSDLPSGRPVGDFLEQRGTVCTESAPPPPPVRRSGPIASRPPRGGARAVVPSGERRHRRVDGRREPRRAPRARARCATVVAVAIANAKRPSGESARRFQSPSGSGDRPRARRRSGRTTAGARLAGGYCRTSSRPSRDAEATRSAVKSEAGGASTSGTGSPVGSSRARSKRSGHDLAAHGRRRGSPARRRPARSPRRARASPPSTRECRHRWR